VAGAAVDFFPQIDNNPHYRGEVLSADRGGFQPKVTAADGSFQIAVLPGPGHLLLWGPGEDYVRMETTRRRLTDDAAGGERIYLDGLLKYDLKPRAEAVELKPRLRRGVTVRGRLVGPGGEGVARADMLFRPFSDLTGTYVSHMPTPVTDGRFELRGCDPDKVHTVYFLDSSDRWGARAEIAGKQTGDEPVTVRLAECGLARVHFRDLERLLKHNASPTLVLRPGCGRRDYAAFQKGEVAEEAVRFLDRGRFDREDKTIAVFALIPGVTYRLPGVTKEIKVEAGKTVDLEAEVK
jgi:hypothetical protein